MNHSEFTVILVSSTNRALCAEKLLSRRGLRCKLIPVPRQLSSDCGVCVRVARSDREAAQQLLGEAGIPIESIHDI